MDASVAVDWPVVHAMAVAVGMVVRCGDWHHAIVGMRNMCMSIVAMSGACRVRNTSYHAMVVAVAEVTARADPVAVMLGVSQRAMLQSIATIVMVVILISVVVVD